MSENEIENREYSEKEVDAILKRAIDLQEQELRTPDLSGRLTAHDILKIAHDAGISNRYIEQAIAELEEKTDAPHSIKKLFFGGPSSFTLKQEIFSEMQKEDFGQLIPLIQKTLHVQGFSSIIGNTVTWHHDNIRTAKSLQICITQKEKKVAVEISANFNQLKGGIFGGLMAGLGGGVGIGIGMAGLGALQSILFPFLWIPGILGFTWLLARTIFRSITGSEQKKIAKLMKEFKNTIPPVRDIEIKTAL
jgi:hypothetical protein